MSLIPSVSVVTPFHNAEAHIGEAIASVLSQTFQNWELLLIDDSSTDQSLAIAKKASATDSRIIVLDHPTDAKRGAAAARNEGVAAARGEFVAFLDADDLFNADKLECDIALLHAHPKAMMAYGPTRWWHPEAEYRDWTEDMSGYGTKVHEPPTLLADVLLLQKGEVPCTCSVLVRRDAIAQVGGFEDGFVLYEDQTLWAKLFLRYPIVVSDVARAVYRQHPNSVSATAARSGEYNRFKTHSARKAFLEWIADYVAESGLMDAKVERAIRISLSEFAEHRSKLRASDRVYILARRMHVVARHILRLSSRVGHLFTSGLSSWFSR